MSKEITSEFGGICKRLEQNFDAADVKIFREIFFSDEIYKLLEELRDEGISKITKPDGSIPVFNDETDKLEPLFAAPLRSLIRRYLTERKYNELYELFYTNTDFSSVDKLEIFVKLNYFEKIGDFCYLAGKPNEAKNFYLDSVKLRLFSSTSSRIKLFLLTLTEDPKIAKKQFELMLPKAKLELCKYMLTWLEKSFGKFWANTLDFSDLGSLSVYEDIRRRMYAEPIFEIPDLAEAIQVNRSGDENKKEMKKIVELKGNQYWLDTLDHPKRFILGLYYHNVIGIDDPDPWEDMEDQYDDGLKLIEEPLEPYAQLLNFKSDINYRRLALDTCIHLEDVILRGFNTNANLDIDENIFLRMKKHFNEIRLIGKYNTKIALGIVRTLEKGKTDLEGQISRIAYYFYKKDKFDVIYEDLIMLFKINDEIRDEIAHKYSLRMDYQDYMKLTMEINKAINHFAAIDKEFETYLRNNNLNEN